MRKTSVIVIAGTVIAFIPIIAVVTLKIVTGDNTLSDYNFWYEYMGYFGTVLLSTFALFQTQKLSEENDKSQTKLEQYQKDLVTANERANEISNMLLKMQIRDKKACFVPKYFSVDKPDSTMRHFGKVIVTVNTSDNISIIRKTCCICNGKKIENNDLNTFVGCKNKFAQIDFHVNPTNECNKLVLYIFLENENSFKYVQTIDIGYELRTKDYEMSSFNIRYFNTWLVPELQEYNETNTISENERENV